MMIWLRLTLLAPIAVAIGCLSAPIIGIDSVAQHLPPPPLHTCGPAYAGPPDPPPNGFAPMSATDAQLACYGFPPRKHDPRNQAGWTEAIRRARVWVRIDGQGDLSAAPRTARGLAEGAPRLARRFPGLAAPLAAPALLAKPSQGRHRDIRLWGGYLTNVETRDVWGQWQVPDQLKADLHETTDWVGMGGTRLHNGMPIAPLYQAGTSVRDGDCALFHRCSSPTFSFFYDHPPFFETHLNPALFPLQPGDRVYVEVWYSRGVAHYFFENLSSGLYASTVQRNVAAPAASPTAEWIEEDAATATDASIPYSPPYAQVRFDHNGLALRSGRDITLADLQRIVMGMGRQRHVYLAPSALRGDSFRVCTGDWIGRAPLLPRCP